MPFFIFQEARQRAARRTNNLQAYVDWFNRLSYLVATTVCQRKKKKLRVKTIEFWIEVARECVNIGNFNSLMGIITGLNMIPVARLKRTWTKIQVCKIMSIYCMEKAKNIRFFFSEAKFFFNAKNQREFTLVTSEASF